MPDSSGGSGIGQVSLNKSQFTWAQREPGFTGIRSHYHTIFEVWVTLRLLQGEVQNRNYSSGVDPLFFAHLPNIDCFTHVHMFFKKKSLPQTRSTRIPSEFKYNWTLQFKFCIMYNTSLICRVLGDIISSWRLLNISIKIVWWIEQNLTLSSLYLCDGGTSCLATLARPLLCCEGVVYRSLMERERWVLVLNRKIFISNMELIPTVPHPSFGISLYRDHDVDHRPLEIIFGLPFLAVITSLFDIVWYLVSNFFFCSSVTCHSVVRSFTSF